MRYYSQTTGCTYLKGLNDAGMPADAVTISEALYMSVIAAPAPGTVRSHGPDGLPFLIGYQMSPEIVYQQKYADINQACELAITSGFTSTALGEEFLYNSQVEDQLNLSGIIQAAIDSPYACRDAQGVKAYRPHTAAQLREVGNDFTAFKLQLLQRSHDLKQLLDQALAAGDLAAIEAVTWASGQI